jgi:hypothetical protein
MSIWASITDIGEDDDGKFDGSVVSYIQGWSNHYPTSPMGDTDLAGEESASVDTAWLPSWCVPGNRPTEAAPLSEWRDVDECVGPWLRLGVRCREVSVWTERPVTGPLQWHAVCLNEAAVCQLRDDLSEWLEREKVHPQKELQQP